MILLVAFALVVATVPLFGGQLSRLASLQVRWLWLLYAGLGIQLLIIEVLPSTFPGADVLHLTSYALAVVFLFMNRSMPGMLVVAIGATANIIAIASNGGVMPASAHALAVAGRTGKSEHFANSTSVSHAHFAFLGDVFAIPARFPLANVFSIGDVLLLLGGAVTVHVVCGSHLPRATRFAGQRSPG